MDSHISNSAVNFHRTSQQMQHKMQYTAKVQISSISNEQNNKLLLKCVSTPKRTITLQNQLNATF